MPTHWVLLLGLTALAQDTEDAPPPATTPPASDEDAELDEIMAALEAEAAAAPPAALPPPPPAPGGTGGALQSMNPDMSLIADVAGAWFQSDAPRMVGGHDPTVTGVSLQQLEMSVQGAVDPYFRMTGNLVFSPGGVEIEEIYATSTALPGRFQLRAGQFLTHFGRVNATHPHSWDFVDQALPIGRVFGGEGNRGLGAELSWLAPLPWSVELIASETMANGAATARSFYGAQDLGVDRPTDLQTTLDLEQFFPLSDDWGLMWGLSFAGGPNPTGRDNRSEIYGTDVFLKWRPLSQARPPSVKVQAEWFHRRRQLPDQVLVDWTGYEQVSWFFLGRWGLAARHELGTPARDLSGGRVPDPLDPEWSDDRHRLAANLTFWPTEFSRFRLQGERDVAGWDEAGPEHAVFLAAEFNIGAHGAHAY